jgi:dolichol-phosphate mannosyltransferase
VGFTSLIISIWLLSGIIIFFIGIVGLYIGKTFENVKKRPTFIIKDTLNLEED